MKDNDIIRTPEEARRCFKNTARWKHARAMVLADRSEPCHLCHEPIRFDLVRPHPLSPSVDHLPGYRVDEAVGMEVWQARFHLTDVNGLKPAHYGCNSKDRGRFLAERAESQAEPEPMTLTTFRNRKTGEELTALANSNSILSDDWEIAS